MVSLFVNVQNQHSTAFYWRQKILDAIKQFVRRGDVDGLVEAGETFFLESFKRQHKKNKQFKMPRKVHKRGGQARTRGISKEYVCVSTAIDRKGNIIVEMTNKGRVSSDNLKRLYKHHSEEESIVCTDSHRSYDRLTKDLKLTHVKLKGSKIKEGIYHIQRVNSFYSKLKKWIGRFNGVSTKHVSNYLGWFKWLEIFKEEKEKVKMRYLFLPSNQHYTNTIQRLKI
ncbi:IS1595 family transposase [Haloplasma contractile]|uniref:Transposase protein n=1 Tax=Haloplasma contractile SSD-17B TaxID=1033810 RepID=U2FG31_9MOLU|nr:IS1595 family transposase [Haloplasma contractile]ERJ11855.1 transposase protein [Haloplasma contractile SSD-17B]